MLHDTSIFVEPSSLFFAIDLSNPICSNNSELAGFPVAFFASAYHHPRFSIISCCGRNLNFNSTDVKISCNMNLKSWSNCGLSWNRCIDPGIWTFAKECVFSAGWCSVTKTIIYVRNSFVAHLIGDSSHECCIFTNSREWDFFLQCSTSLKLFSQSVSRNLFPDAPSLLLGVCTKELTSCGFTFLSRCTEIHVFGTSIFQWRLVMFFF